MPTPPTQPLRPAASDRLVFRPGVGSAGDVLVAIFLRGGMDGVYTVPPFADPAYRVQRGGLGMLTPGRDGLVNLDDFYGLHPDFSPLESLYRRGLLAIVHAVGLSEPLLSHFEATHAIECGAADSVTQDGWIGRHLSAQPAAGASALRAVAIGCGMPLVLRGTAAQALDSLAEFRLEFPAGWEPQFSRALHNLYARGSDLASVSGRKTLETMTALERLSRSTYRPESSAPYAVDRFGSHLQQVAQLVKAEVGLEAAVLNLDGWDSHGLQAESLRSPMLSLAYGLQGFVEDLGDRMRRLVVVVISEFGRRVVPNLARGTDHGRGSAMFVIGGGIRGGKVYRRWPGLAAEQLDPQGNLLVTTDYRHVLAEIVERRLKNRLLDRVFPNFAPQYLEFTNDT